MLGTQYLPFVLGRVEDTVQSSLTTHAVAAEVYSVGLAGGTEGVLIGGQLGLAHQAAVLFPQFIHRCSTIVYSVVTVILEDSLEHRLLPPDIR
jgi:hypothetical protein